MNTSIFSDKSSNIWQHPYVDIFKHVDLPNWVIEGIDRVIGKRVYTLQGSTSASTSITIPDKGKSLGLTGRYIYFECKGMEPELYVIHITIKMKDSSSLLRISISNMYKRASFTSPNTIQIPFKFPKEKWTILSIDLLSIVKEYSDLNPSDDSIEWSWSIKNIQICATLVIRGVYTSDTAYSEITLPRDMKLPLRNKKTFYDDYDFCWLPEMRNDEMIMGGKNGISEIKTSNKDKEENGEKENREKEKEKEKEEKGKENDENKENKTVSSSSLLSTSFRSTKQMNKSKNDNNLLKSYIQAAKNVSPLYKSNTKSLNSLNSNSDFPSSHSQSKTQISQALLAQSLPHSVLQPDPIMSLKSTIGFNNEYHNIIKWNATSSLIYYPSGPLLISMERYTTTTTDDDENNNNNMMMVKQNILLRHKRPIKRIEIDKKGEFILTVESGKNPILIYWDICSNSSLRPFRLPINEIYDMNLSGNSEYLVVSGNGIKGLTEIILYSMEDIKNENVDSNRFIPPIVKKNNEANVKRIKFCPFSTSSSTLNIRNNENEQVISCGYENIRFWRRYRVKRHNNNSNISSSSNRISMEVLHSCPVVLNEYGRGVTYTDIAFESSFDINNSYFDNNNNNILPRIFVSSNKGTVVQINSANKALECVFRLHDDCINSLLINEGFCISGSDDGYVRVWPLDFSDFYLEANHDVSITSLDISNDGLDVIIGSSNGVIGILNISDHKHKTLLRSHSDEILSIEISPNNKTILTTSRDGSLRLWDINSLSELREFKSKCKNMNDNNSLNEINPCQLYDLALCSCFNSANANIVSIGFESGMVKIVDINEQKLIKQMKQHNNKVISVIYHNSGHYLYSCSVDGSICIYDVSDNYNAIKQSESKGPLGIVNSSMKMNDVGNRLSLLVPDGLEIIIYDCITLNITNHIYPPDRNKRKLSSLIMMSDDSNNIVNRLLFKEMEFVHGFELLTILSSNEMYIYNVENGSKVRSCNVMCNSKISSLCISCPLYFVCGSENGSILVNDLLLKNGSSNNGNGCVSCSSQCFVGHNGKVKDIKMSKNGRYLVSIDESNSLYIWEFYGNENNSENELKPIVMSYDNMMIDDSNNNIVKERSEILNTSNTSNTVSSSSISSSIKNNNESDEEDEEYSYSGSELPPPNEYNDYENNNNENNENSENDDNINNIINNINNNNNVGDISSEIDTLSSVIHNNESDENVEIDNVIFSSKSLNTNNTESELNTENENDDNEEENEEDDNNNNNEFENTVEIHKETEREEEMREKEKEEEEEEEDRINRIFESVGEYDIDINNRLKLSNVLGYNGNGVDNVIFLSDYHQLLYTINQRIIIHDIETRNQMSILCEGYIRTIKYSCTLSVICDILNENHSILLFYRLTENKYSLISKHHYSRYINEICFNESGRYMCVSVENGLVEIYDLISSEIYNFECENTVNHIIWFENSSLLYSINNSLYICEIMSEYDNIEIVSHNIMFDSINDKSEISCIVRKPKRLRNENRKYIISKKSHFLYLCDINGRVYNSWPLDCEINKMNWIDNKLYISGLFNGLYMCKMTESFCNSMKSVKVQPPSSYIRIDGFINSISIEETNHVCFIGSTNNEIYELNINEKKLNKYINKCDIDGLKMKYCLNNLLYITCNKDRLNFWDCNSNIKVEEINIKKDLNISNNNNERSNNNNIEVSCYDISNEIDDELIPICIGLNDGRVLFYNLYTNQYLNHMRCYNSMISSVCFVNDKCSGIIVGTIDGSIGYTELEYENDNNGDDDDNNNIKLRFVSHTIDLSDKYMLNKDSEIDVCLSNNNNNKIFLCTSRNRQISIWKIIENEPSPIDTFKINDKNEYNNKEKILLNNERPNTPTLGLFSPIENNIVYLTSNAYPPVLIKYNYSSRSEEYSFDLESFIIDMDYGFSLKNAEIMYLCFCSYNGCIVIINPQTFELICHINHGYDPIYNIKYNLNGEDIIVSSENEIEIWKFNE